MQLQIDPLLHAQLADFLDIARAGAEGQPVHRLQDLLVLG